MEPPHHHIRGDKMSKIDKVCNKFLKLCKVSLTCSILFIMGAICKAGLECGSFGVACVFIFIALVGGFWVIGLIWGWNKDEVVEEPPKKPNEFTGDDALSCIAGKVISNDITRGIK